jgi:hypothetical protein
VGNAEVKDQAPAPGLIPQIAPNLHIAAPLACACRNAVLSAYRVSGRAEQRPQYGHHPVVRLGCTGVSCACGGVVAVQIQSVPLATALSKRAVGETVEGGKHWDTYT